MSSSFSNRTNQLATNLRNYLRSVNQQFLKTSDRSLEQAYQAVLRIQDIENEHFNGNKVSAESVNHTTSVTSCLQSDLNKKLNIAKLRVLEFKTSTFVFGNLSANHLAKLKLVDEVLDRYENAAEDNTSQVLVPLSETVKNNSSKANIQPYSTVDTISVETVNDKTGVLPRSIGRTINKIKNDFSPNKEQEVIRKFRSSRAKTTTAVRFVFTLILVPLLIQLLSKNLLISPIVNRVRVENIPQLFLHSEMKESALRDLQGFEEEIKFDNIINLAPPMSEEVIEERVKYRAAEIAKEYWQKSNSAISNVFADLLALGAFILVLLVSRREITILKSFMDEIVYGLSDSAKAFIIILFTDIFVGFHSPPGWEVLLEGFANHLGIPANHSYIFLFIATFPVILDTIVKYWIFRYLSRISPSALATLKTMNE
ncbi:proton extrusion protein PcxA [Komarekiella sp. 'clone 1']|uniref:Proton extrusion protein PxcA n=1 Tax=Komarekiella delphini-convector SJRDD-AB1 TaxID=2593771 RepID=A0AA40VPQ1_9NOST|nr:proton extrusion protein PcxA [Komarekiella delphini-convector SJRDD-AB1]